MVMHEGGGEGKEGRARPSLGHVHFGCILHRDSFWQNLMEDERQALGYYLPRPLRCGHGHKHTTGVRSLPHSSSTAKDESGGESMPRPLPEAQLMSKDADLVQVSATQVGFEEQPFTLGDQPVRSHHS